ncbi:MAG TPA: carbamate kinase [Acidobacteriota bacterium]|nr:carbamate kinase [Acidobacteriota bacterium]
MSKLVLVAVGGNALIRGGQKGTAQEQFENAVETAAAVVRLIRAGHRVVLTHGNGPQVGAQLVRSELAAAHAYRLPLDCCVASTQGEVGYVLQYAMWQMMQAEGLKTPVVTLVTQVLVDPRDRAFRSPTKPIGPSYNREAAERYSDLLDWVIVEDPAHGFRRVVPSPEPVAIVELDAIKACVDRGLVVIAAGGGGVPVFNDHDITKGVEAVVDKDHTSAILARQLDADVFAIATDVDRVYLDFGKSTQRPLDHLTVSQCRQYLQEGQFPPGSMGPKITAAIKYLELGGTMVVITDHDHILDALEGKAGTQIVQDEAGDRP